MINSPSIRTNVTAALAAVALLGASAAISPSIAADPAFDRLVEANASALFGGHLKLEKNDRFTLTFHTGHFEKGFACKPRGRGQILSDPTELKSPVYRKVLIDGHKGEFSFVTTGGGTALSKFELANDYTMSFRLRAPRLASGAKLDLSFNRTGKSYIRTRFFQDLSVTGAKRAQAKTSKAQFSGAPSAWFDQKSPGVPVSIEYRGDKMTIRMGVVEDREKDKYKMVEVVALEGIKDPSKGKIGLVFDKVSFLVSDLRITGKFPREWAEKEIARLRDAKKLRVPKEAGGAGEKGAKGKGDETTGQKKKRSRSNEPDLDQPDPEADDEL